VTPATEARLELLAHVAFCDGVEASCQPEWEYPATDWELCPEGERLRSVALSLLDGAPLVLTPYGQDMPPPEVTQTSKETDTRASSVKQVNFSIDSAGRPSRNDHGT